MVLMVLLKYLTKVDQLQSSEKKEKNFDPSSYTPEKVFQKSRFHVMGVIKTSLQDQVIEAYNTANQPLPSTQSTAM